MHAPGGYPLSLRFERPQSTSEQRDTAVVVETARQCGVALDAEQLQCVREFVDAWHCLAAEHGAPSDVHGDQCSRPAITSREAVRSKRVATKRACAIRDNTR